MMSPIEPPHTILCRFAAKSPLIMMVQVVTAVRLTRSYAEGHASFAGKADVCKDVVAEEMAAGTRTGTTARRTVTTATVASTRTGTHTEAAALEACKVYAGEVAATNPPVEVEDGARILAKTTGDVAGTVAILPSMGGATVPSASHEADDAKEQAHVVQESAAWFTRVQVDSSEGEDFAIVIGDDTQVQKDVPAAAQPQERAAGDVQVKSR